MSEVKSKREIVNMDGLLNKLHQLREKWDFWDIWEKAISSIRKGVWPLAKLWVRTIPAQNTASEHFTEIFKWKTVAIVWNSPILTHSWNGWGIDDHDLVIRMNAGIIWNTLNTEDTWVKTDIWATWTATTLVNPVIKDALSNISKELRAIIVSWPDNPSKYISWISQLFLFLRFLQNSWVYYLPVDLYDQLIEELSEEISKISRPSTWFAVFKTLEWIEEIEAINLYGFTFNTDHRILEPAKNVSHNFRRESEYVQWAIQTDSRIRLIV